MRSWLKYDVFNTLEMYFGIPSATPGLNALRCAYGKNKDITAEKVLCDYFLQDGSFLKIDAVNLGYTWPLASRTKGFIQSLRVYASVNNVCTLTGYSGMDPEININGFDGGIEWWNTSFYPRTRTYLFGVQLTF